MTLGSNGHKAEIRVEAVRVLASNSEAGFCTSVASFLLVLWRGVEARRRGVALGWDLLED